MVAAPTPVEIFCSYAHEDDTWQQKLETHMSLLKRQGLISLWHDRQILPGTDWTRSIDARLETASVILLLVSADFLASDYCYSVEMKRALERQEAGEARVIPILVRSVDWESAPFAHLQVLPTDAKPLASWQDEDRALADVAAGIRRAIEDVPLLMASAPRAALPRIWNIPYPRNPFFLGRDSQLIQIYRYLREGHLSRPLAISGLGGIGKTQLALEYAYRYHQDYHMVLWTRAESTEALVSSYIALAALLRLPEREVKEQDITVQAVKAWLQTHRDWLLILDNADELALLADFLPPIFGGHLLLTTRAASTGRLARRLGIETLEPAQGALFLLRRAALLVPDAELSQASKEERELAMRISQELGGLPLALDQAGAYLEETGTSLTDYRLIYQQNRADLLQQRRGLVADHPSPVATTWSLAFQRVEEQNPAAADLLRLCAFLSPDAIPEEILTKGASLLGPVLAPVAADAFRLNQAIETVRACLLVGRDPKEKTLSLHRLVQAVLQDAMEEGERRCWAERAVLAVNAAFPEAKHSTWEQGERLLPQALAATQGIERYQISGEEAGRLLYETAFYLYERARYAVAGPLFLQALQIREKHLGAEHPDVATSLDGLANLYRDQGKYSEAEPLYLRALQIRERVLEPLHPNVADSLCHLANLYCDQGKYPEAEPLYHRSLHIRERCLGTEHPKTAYSLNDLANLYRGQGKYTEAESLYNRALQMRERLLGPRHPRVGTSLNGLASLYRDQGRYTEAEPIFQNARDICENALGLLHPETAEIMHDLGGLREAQGNSEKARTCYAQALTIREQMLGPRHPKTIETRTRLIALLHAMGLHEAAAQQEAVQSEF